jgi:uncharacterized protein DUF5658
MRYQWLAPLLAAGIFFASAPAHAQSNLFAEQQRSTALKYELGYLALSVLDTAQTIECIERGRCEEANPLFGKHPKTGKLIASKLALGALHFTAFNYINKRNPRGALRFAQGSLLIQGGVVMLNSRFMF